MPPDEQTPTSAPLSSPPPTDAPLRWAAAGAIAGVAITAMLWSILGRAPRPIQPAPPRSAYPTAAAAPPEPVATDPSPATLASAARATAQPALSPTPRPAPTLAVAEPTPTQPDDSTDTAAAPSPATNPVPIPDSIDDLTERIRINRATQAQLELLPNIGPTLAARIIAFREAEGPIRSLTHLTDVRGIGVRTAEDIEPYIRFD